MCSFDARTIRGIASWPSTLILQDTQNTDHQGKKNLNCPATNYPEEGDAFKGSMNPITNIGKNIRPTIEPV